LSEPSVDSRRTTRHGLALLAWTLVFGLMVTALTDRMGLKYVQGVIWPTDLHTLELRQAPRQLDVAILGSSRASFDLTPAVIDDCLAEQVGRPTTTVNLARVFATGHTMSHLYDDLLAHDPPKVLVVGVTAEALDDTNPMMRASVQGSAGVDDIASELLGARSLPQVVAALRPVVRGAETLPFFLAQRHLGEARLSWIMDHHGGGQWCAGSPACEAQNRDLEKVLARRWDRSLQDLPRVGTERFADYNAEKGRAINGLAQLIDAAKQAGVHVILIDLPLHQRFQDEIPQQATDAYEHAITALAKAHEVTLYRPDIDHWTTSRRSWVDTDHLSRLASAELSRMLCREALADAMAGSHAP